MVKCLAQESKAEELKQRNGRVRILTQVCLIPQIPQMVFLSTLQEHSVPVYFQVVPVDGYYVLWMNKIEIFEFLLCSSD